MRTYSECARDLYAQGFSHVAYTEYCTATGKGRRLKQAWARIVPVNAPDKAKLWPPSDQDSAGDCGFRIVWPEGYPKSAA